MPLLERNNQDNQRTETENKIIGEEEITEKPEANLHLQSYIYRVIQLKVVYYYCDGYKEDQHYLRYNNPIHLSQFA